MIADGLEAGAEALRQRKTSTSVATTAGSSVTVADDSSIAAVTDTLASGMQSSAEWLRDADIDKLKQGVEKQVKEHPARSLLVALGAGYLIGKALRR
jgi:rRNA maturation endonuclease Nob1